MSRVQQKTKSNSIISKLDIFTPFFDSCMKFLLKNFHADI